MKKVRNAKFIFSDPCWLKISEKAKDLIKKLLIKDPKERPSAQDALKDPWFTEMIQSTVDKKLTDEALSNLKTFRAATKGNKITFAFIVS